MPRTARMKSDSRTYHILARANEGKPLFCCDDDYASFIDVLKNVKRAQPFKLFAFSLIENCIHLVIGEIESKCGRIAQSVFSAYAQRYNRAHSSTGSVYYDRYVSEPIEGTEYLLACVRFVHQRGGVTSFDLYRGSVEKNSVLACADGLCNTAEILELLGGIAGFELFSAEREEKPFAVYAKKTRPQNSQLEKIILDEFGVAAADVKSLSRTQRDAIIKRLFCTDATALQIAQITQAAYSTVLRRKGTD